MHVPHESAPGPPSTAQSRPVASDSTPETPLTKGCQTWLAVDRRIKFVDSLLLASLRLLFALRGYSDEEMSYARHHALVTRKFRWYNFGSTNYGLIGSRKVGF